MHFLRLAAACVVVSFLSAGAGAAQVDADWEARKVPVKQACEDFRATTPIEETATGSTSARADRELRQPPTPPARAPVLPYVCVFVQFDVDAKGQTKNQSVVFKAPDGASRLFERAALRAVKRWRYDPTEGEGGVSRTGVVTMLTFESW